MEVMMLQILTKLFVLACFDAGTIEADNDWRASYPHGTMTQCQDAYVLGVAEYHDAGYDNLPDDLANLVESAEDAYVDVTWVRE